MGSRRRVFIPTESVTIAHVVRPLQVAKALRRKGVEIIFGASERYRALIEKEGFEVRPIYCAEPSVLLNAVRRLDFRAQLARIPAYLESDIQAIGSIPGLDLVFSDCRFTARFAAEKFGIPHVAMANGIHSPYYDAFWSIPQTISSSWPSWLRENRLLGRVLKEVISRYQALPYRKLCRRYRLTTKIRYGFDIFLSDTLNLLCDIPEFAPQKSLPDHYQFIPILWEQDSAVEPLPAKFDGKRRPLIYITFGTSGEDDMLKQMVESLRDMPYDIVISMAAPNLKELPDNIFVTPLAKVSDVLEKASLLVCHGGSGTIYQALAHGVPILCVTTFYDQEWNGDRVRYLGLGDSIFHKRLDAPTLRAAVARMIGDAKMKQNLKRFKSLMPSLSGADLAAQKIVQLLDERRGSPSA